jgi:hypothetical protein
MTLEESFGNKAPFLVKGGLSRMDQSHPHAHSMRGTRLSYILTTHFSVGATEGKAGECDLRIVIIYCKTS